MLKLRPQYRLLPTAEREFSLRSRTQRWQALQKQAEEFDLIIVGGGIVGAGVAFEASGRGLKVALVEKGDFANGTSSKSSKLLHGGLRYLEQYEFGLVFEALSARNGLFSKFPHLAKKVPFLMPVYRHYEERAWFINLGCWLYDVFSWISSPFHTIRHRWVDASRLAEMEPEIRQDNFEGGLEFYDAYCDDARLVLETIKTAQAAGATVFNHAAVTDFIKNDKAQVRGVVLQDQLNPEAPPLQLKGRRVVNATGPWADHLNRLANPDEPRYLRPSKGVHLIIPRVTHAKRSVMLKTIPDAQGKQRWMFIIPYDEYSIVGTTDTDYEGDMGSDYLDHDNYASSEDVRYLLASVNAIYPQANVQPEDIISSFGGWRPLVSPPGKGGEVHESDISRDHEIFETTTGLVMIAGGKLTTYLYMASDLLDYLKKHIRGPFNFESQNLLLPLCNRINANSLEELQDKLAPWLQDLEPVAAERLVARYGAEVVTLMGLRKYFEGGLEPIAGLSEETPLLALEVVYSVLYEQSLTLKDMLMRRQRVLLRDQNQGQQAARPVAKIMAEVLGHLCRWSAEFKKQWIEEQVQDYLAEVERSNAWREDYHSEPSGHLETASSV